jgi:AraC family transcriptional regulator of arabinose operon
VWYYLWAHFTPRPHWYPWLQWPKGPDGLRHTQLSEGVYRDRFEHAARLATEIWYSPMPGAPELAATYIEMALFWAGAGRVDSASRGPDPRIARATDYLIEHMAQPYDVEALARHCRVSTSRLEHLFSEHVGMGPRQFLEDIRMQRARQLLEHTLRSVAEIATEVGFADQGYFTRRFRQSIGVSPSEHRQRPDGLRSTPRPPHHRILMPRERDCPVVRPGSPSSHR